MQETIELPAKLQPVFAKEYGSVRYRGAFGGRGSAKSVTFTKMTAYFGMMLGMRGYQGVILCAREFMNSLDESSMADVKFAIGQSKTLSAYWEVGEKYIKSRDGRIRYAFSGLTGRTIDAIKSKAKILLCLVDEADAVTEDAWSKLLPTIREEGSELWVVWNPEAENSATDLRFRKTDLGESAMIVEMNYLDNPWFPSVLEAQRLEDLKYRSAMYGHIWLGEYKVISDDPLFTFQLPRYEEVPITLFRSILRIDTAQKGGKINDCHGFSLIGYTYQNNFDELKRIMGQANMPFNHSMNASVEYAYLLDAGRWSCGFVDLADNIVEVVKHYGKNMMPRESFDGIVIEDANVGSALRETLREHKKLNDWSAVNIGLTPKYKNKFARANESVIQLQQGKLIIPNQPNRYTNRFSDLSQFEKEFSTFTETDKHASDDVLDTVLWEIVSKFGAAGSTVWS